MQEFTFTYKTKVEQFQEQFPELYQEIWHLGYNEAMHQMYSDPIPESDNDPWEYQPQYATPTDDSERFYMFDDWKTIYNKAIDLYNGGYTPGNRDWRDFMNNYRSWNNMYIAWNPTHKQFAVESDPGTINEMYSHLVGAVKHTEELPKK